MCDNEKLPTIIEIWIKPLCACPFVGNFDQNPLCLYVGNFAKPFVYCYFLAGFSQNLLLGKTSSRPGALSDCGQTDRQTDTSRTGFVGLWPRNFFFLGSEVFFQRIPHLSEYWERFTGTLV